MKRPQSPYRILLSSLVLGLAVSACSGGGTSEPGSGGATQASGGATSSGGSSGGGTGGRSTSTGGTSAVGSGGSEATGGTGGTIQGTGGSSAGTGGNGAGGSSAGTGGNGAGGSSAGTGGNGAGGSSGSGGGGGGGTKGSGAGGNAGASSSGGSGGKLDQSALPAVTIHMAGDSTMSDYDATTTQEGWGQELGQFFISKITIDNQAQPGANIDTFYSGRWKTLINNVKAGDYVFAAFGINDSGTTHGPVAPAAFQTQMGVMADEVAAKKATFVPTTSSPLQVWVGGKETNTRLQPYCDATIAVGMAKGLLVDDLNARGVAYYNMIGETAAAALTFNGDKAHFDKAGATEMAQLAAQELMRINSPLAAYLK
jgi:lysophospholipase L1-like esterase